MNNLRKEIRHEVKKVFDEKFTSMGLELEHNRIKNMERDLLKKGEHQLASMARIFASELNHLRKMALETEHDKKYPNAVSNETKQRNQQYFNIALKDMRKAKKKFNKLGLK